MPMRLSKSQDDTCHAGCQNARLHVIVFNGLAQIRRGSVSQMLFPVALPPPSHERHDWHVHALLHEWTLW
jgi:hypothetical protein